MRHRLLLASLLAACGDTSPKDTIEQDISLWFSGLSPDDQARLIVPAKSYPFDLGVFIGNLPLPSNP